MKKQWILVCLLSVLCVLSGFTQTAIKAGLKAYGSADYSLALRLFRDITLDPELEESYGDAYFWIGKSYLAMERFDEAEKNLEFFLLNYPENANYAEAAYQKGRLLFFQEDFDNSILAFSEFIESYPDSPFLPNAYYWMGECLFSLGNFDKALDIFTIVVNRYPTSFRYEAAKYRISLLKLNDREQEFLKLLKISHEDFLNAQEDFLRKEKTYEKAIEKYQKTISILSDTSEYDEAMEALEKKIQNLEGDLQISMQAREVLQTEYDALKSEKDKLEGVLEAREEGYRENLAAQEKKVQETLAALSSKEQEEYREINSEQTRIRLLQLKIDALELKNFYLDWLLENGETEQ